MKKLWTALLSAILCCSLAFGAVSVCAETGGDTNVVPVLTREIHASGLGFRRKI